MSKRRELEQQASSFAKKIDEFLHKNTNLKIHGVARQGSRKEGTHEDLSDLDIVFAVSNNPKKEEIYPELSKKLESVLNVKTNLGSDRNVIKIKKGELPVDLVLLTIEEFEKQIKENRIKRMESS